MGKKIVCLINYTLNVGGAERQTAELANYLAENDYKVFIIILRQGKIFYKLNENVNCLQPDFTESDSRMGKAIYFLKIGFYIRKLLLRLNPDIIFNTAFPSFILFFSMGIKIPIYSSIRCDPNVTKRIEVFNIPLSIRRPLYRRCKGIIAQTVFAKEVLERQFKRTPILVIPNILNNVSDKIEIRENIILSVGRLIKSKGFDLLISAFSKIDHIGDWKLMILGEGPERPNLENHIQNLGMTGKVLLVGTKTNTHEYYRKSKIFAFASLSEGFPNVLLEAMGAPLPCISFDCDAGPRDIITDGVNGFLIGLYDVDTFARRLEILMNDEVVRNNFMSEAIKVRKYFNRDKICKEYLNLIADSDN